MVLLQDREKQRRKAPPSVLVKTFQPSERVSEFETLEVRVSGPFSSHMLTRGQERTHKQLQHISLTEFGEFFCEVPRECPFSQTTMKATIFFFLLTVLARSRGQYYQGLMNYLENRMVAMEVRYILLVWLHLVSFLYSC